MFHFPQDLYQWLFATMIAISMIVRTPYVRTNRLAKQQKNMALVFSPVKENIIAFVFGIGIIVLPLFYCFSDYLSQWNLLIPQPLRIIATLITLFGFAIVIKSHLDLGEQWSPVLETKKDHRLIVTGLYKYVRHPMYSGFCLWSVGVGLMLPNYAMLLAAVFSYLIIYLIRIPAEEMMMKKQFGQQYLDYKKKTGKIFPKIF